jgi:hypothetical protein
VRSTVSLQRTIDLRIQTDRAATCRLRLRPDPDSIVRDIAVRKPSHDLRDTLRGRKNRRRRAIEFPLLQVRKLPHHIQLRARASRCWTECSLRGADRYSPEKGGDGRPDAITPSITPSVLCQVLCEESKFRVCHLGATWTVESVPVGKISP